MKNNVWKFYKNGTVYDENGFCRGSHELNVDEYYALKDEKGIYAPFNDHQLPEYRAIPKTDSHFGTMLAYIVLPGAAFYLSLFYYPEYTIMTIFMLVVLGCIAYCFLKFFKWLATKF